MELLLGRYRCFFSTVVCFLLFFLSGCDADISKKSQKKNVLESELLNISDLITGKPLNIGIVADYLLIRNTGNDTWFTLINLEDPQNKNFKTGYMGEGPGELSNPGAVVVDDRRFIVLEGSNKRLISFHLDSIINEAIPKYIPGAKPISLEVRPIINLIRLNRAYYVTNEVSFERRFSLIDSLGMDVFRFGEFPREAVETGNHPFYISNIAYQSELTSNASRSIIASATRYGEYIEFTHIDTEKKQAELISRHMGQLPEYNNDDINGSPNFGLNDKTIAGYLAITSDDEYVYALYSGKVIRSPGSQAYISNKVQAFNWEGEFLYELELDKEVSKIVLDKNMLYGLFETAAGYDIAKFNIENLEE